MADSPHESRDLLEQDMARHERMFSGEVHAARNQAMAAEALRDAEMRRQVAEYEAQMLANPSPPAETEHPVEPRTERRELNGQRYVLDVSPADDSVFRSTTEFEANVLAHAQPRIALLLSKPDDGPLGTASWRMKTLAAMYFKIKSLEARQSGMLDEANVFERAFQQDLYELLESSNQTFGDWRKDAPTKLIIA